MTSQPARYCLSGARAELLAGGVTLAGQPLNNAALGKSASANRSVPGGVPTATRQPHTPHGSYTADIDGGCEGRAALHSVNAVRAGVSEHAAKPVNVEPNFNARLVIDGFSDAGSWRDALRFHPSQHGAHYDR